MHVKFSIKRTFTAFLTVALLLTGVPFAAHGAEESGFRMGTYYHEQFQEPIEDVVPFDKLTHIVYAFLRPDASGSLELREPEKLAKLVSLGHAAGIEVLIGVGGWGYVDEFETLAASEESRNRFIRELMDYVDEYGADGVDIDWEYPAPGTSAQSFEALTLGLRKELDQRGKLLTAAVIGSVAVDKGMDGAAGITDEALAAYDLLHIMSYDLKGNNGNSPMWYSWVSLQYWGNYRNVPKEKMILGVPFCARPNWRLYKDLVAEDVNNAYIDITQSPGETEPSFYNGMCTMTEKTRLALSQAGGIFSWEINMDTTDEYSLTQVMYDTVKEYEAAGPQQFFSAPAVFYQNRKVSFDEELGQPYVDDNNRTMMPIRKLSQILGIDIDYDEIQREATAAKDGMTLRIPLGEAYIYVNGETVPLDTKAQVKEGWVYLPMRAFLENLGYEVSWIASSTSVYID